MNMLDEKDQKGVFSRDPRRFCSSFHVVEPHPMNPHWEVCAQYNQITCHCESINRKGRGGSGRYDTSTQKVLKKIYIKSSTLEGLLRPFRPCCTCLIRQYSDGCAIRLTWDRFAQNAQRSMGSGFRRELPDSEGYMLRHFRRLDSLWIIRLESIITGHSALLSDVQLCITSTFRLCSPSFFRWYYSTFILSMGRQLMDSPLLPQVNDRSEARGLRTYFSSGCPYSVYSLRVVVGFPPDFSHHNKHMQETTKVLGKELVFMFPETAEKLLSCFTTIVFP